jgi:hypothetical protein
LIVTNESSTASHESPSGGHGSSPAAWTAVSLCLLGFLVGGAGLVPHANWYIFGAGVALVVIAGIAGKVMSAAGLGASH